MITVSPVSGSLIPHLHEGKPSTQLISVTFSPRYIIIKDCMEIDTPLGLLLLCINIPCGHADLKFHIKDQY